MNARAIQKYLNEDYAKACEFYDNRARLYKRIYRVFSVYLIIAPVVLGTMVAFAPDQTCWRITEASISATIAIATGLLAHLKAHENWLSYRKSWDALERERRFFETATGIYKSVSDKGPLFVERIETLLAKEGADFYARHIKDKREITVNRATEN